MAQPPENPATLAAGGAVFVQEPSSSDFCGEIREAQRKRLLPRTREVLSHAAGP